MAKLVYLDMPDVGWVSADGSYGYGSVTVFDPNTVTDFQWQVLDNLADSDKQPYIRAIINGENLTEWESDYK
jgi:hypothetical protein